MSWFLRASAVVVVGLTAIVAASTAAGADPKGLPVHLVCGGVHYQVVVNGNGQFAPAHHVGSTAVFVPVTFTGFRGTLTDVLTGAVVSTNNDPTVISKGRSAPQSRTLTQCTYSFTEQFVAGPRDEGLVAGRTYRFVGEGGVIGFATGRR